jgi:hypothetical protein
VACGTMIVPAGGQSPRAGPPAAPEQSEEAQVFRSAIKDVAGLVEALELAAGGGEGGTGIINYSQIAGLPGYPASFPPATHQHPISQVTDLQATIDDLQAQITTLEGQLATKAAEPLIVESFADVGDTVPAPAAGVWIVELP